MVPYSHLIILCKSRSFLQVLFLVGNRGRGLDPYMTQSRELEPSEAKGQDRSSVPDHGLLLHLPIAGSPEVGQLPVRILFLCCLVLHGQALGACWCPQEHSLGPGQDIATGC